MLQLWSLPGLVKSVWTQNWDQQVLELYHIIWCHSLAQLCSLQVLGCCNFSTLKHVYRLTWNIPGGRGHPSSRDIMELFAVDAFVGGFSIAVGQSEYCWNLLFLARDEFSFFCTRHGALPMVIECWG
jgi:hypothetical protein